MPDTPNLALPLIAAAQAQKHVTHNEALLVLDALLHCAVLDRDLAVPPASPPEGARYIVPAGATGAWAGHADKIASADGAVWRFATPRPGFLAFVVDEGAFRLFDGAAWRPLSGTISSLADLYRLGIGTAADASNPFAAKLNGALWTARTVAEGGSGDLRCVLNKEVPAGILSLLFQSGFSGRLEIGLVGSDEPVVKVSPDGATWREALRIDPSSGGVDARSPEIALASAATLDLGAVRARRILVTGTTAISSFGTAPDRERLLRFAGSLTVQHDPVSLVLPGGANVTTAAGDVALAVSDAAGRWRVAHYARAATAP